MVVGTLPKTEELDVANPAMVALAVDVATCDIPDPCWRELVNEMGPPTSMGESVFLEFVGLLVRLWRGVCVPEEGEPALIDPSD